VVLLALQNFQNLQSAYNQKNACLATIPAASTAPAADAATTPASRDVTFPLPHPCTTHRASTHHVCVRPSWCAESG
jgi:hypothetical protein